MGIEKCILSFGYRPKRIVTGLRRKNLEPDGLRGAPAPAIVILEISRK
jgi:hypothetical protein